MLKKMLLLIMLGFSLTFGSFWALKAQDPAPQQTPGTDRSAMRPQTQTTQTDLSGTYTGTFRCEGLGLTGATPLTINGNEFTTADGKSGRIVAQGAAGYRRQGQPEKLLLTDRVNLASNTKWMTARTPAT